jgi:demethylmacrocin O-methyltransferase
MHLGTLRGNDQRAKVKEKLKSILEKNFSPESYARARQSYWRFKILYRGIMSRIYAHDLTALAKIQATDKLGSHLYTPHYEQHFRSLRKKKLRILEIGVGGYEDPILGGESLRVWKYYFPKSSIYSVDIFDKAKLQEHRIRIFRGSQNDPDFLRKVVEQMGGVDIVIDDGSHVNEHVITSFCTLFPLLAEDGIYVIEDTQSSYWPKLGGDSYDLGNPNTIMNFLKRLTDGLNYEEIARKDYRKTYFDQNIISLHFYHNLVFIYKGRNEEGSNHVHEHIY